MTNDNKKWILLLILSVIWGSSFILIKKSLVGLTPLQVGSLRIIFTAIVISIYSYSSLKEIPKKSWKWIILTAYVGTFFPVYLVSFGQTEIESGLASIITIPDSESKLSFFEKIIFLCSVKSKFFNRPS